MSDQRRRIPVFIVVYDDVQLLDFAGPLQTFVTSDERRSALKASRRTPNYAPKLVSARGGSITTSSGVTVMTEALPSRIAANATIIVAGGIGVDAASRDEILCAWLKKNAPRARRLCSVCTGAFILAECGLLDGLTVTTHWADCDALQARYPNVHVQPNAIYTRNDAIWTSAGISAGIDLTLALIAEDRGASVAFATARWLVVYAKRSGGQSQFSDAIDLASKDPENVFAGLHEWMGENLTKDLSLPVLAARAGMSERSFSRRYVEAVGITPAKAIRLMRAEKARMLLTTTNSALKTVTRRAGFGSLEQMNRSLEAIYGAGARLLRDTGAAKAG